MTIPFFVSKDALCLGQRQFQGARYNSGPLLHTLLEVWNPYVGKSIHTIHVAASKSPEMSPVAFSGLTQWPQIELPMRDDHRDPNTHDRQSKNRKTNGTLRNNGPL